jgi:hypothetical protein
MPTPSAKVIFTKDAVTIHVEGPDGQTDPNVQPQWVTDQTADLTRIAYKTTDTILTTWKMTLNNLTRASMQALRSFFYTTVHGPEATFSYTHTDGLVYTVRFAQADLQFRRGNNNEFSVPLTLEVAGFVDTAP